MPHCPTLSDFCAAVVESSEHLAVIPFLGCFSNSPVAEEGCSLSEWAMLCRDVKVAGVNQEWELVDKLITKFNSVIFPASCPSEAQF